MAELSDDSALRYHLRLAGGAAYGPASLDHILGWAREGRVPRDAMLEPVGGGEPAPVLSIPEIARILNAPPTQFPGFVDTLPKSDTGVSMLIPYKNKPALIGYYLGVASLIPLIGLVTAIPAIVLGICGLIHRARNPQAHGLAHAIVAIVLGVGGPLLWFAALMLVS